VIDDLDSEHLVARGVATSLFVSMGKAVAGAPANQHELNACWLDVTHSLAERYRIS
jgi:hypothetical protein